MEAFKYYISSHFDRDSLSLLEANSIISITDAMGRIEYVNDNFCNIFECDENELLGELLKLLKSPLHADEHYKNLWKTIKLGNKWTGLLEAETFNGNPIWLDTTIVPVKKENALKYVMLYKDITPSQSKVVTLIEKDKKNSEFLNQIPLNIFSITKYGKVLNANKGFSNVEVNNLVGTYIYDYISPNCYEIFKSNIDAVFSEKKIKQFDYSDFDTYGNKQFYTSIVSPVFDELGVLISATICIYQSENKKYHQVEEQKNEAKYRLIYKSMNVGIIVVTDKKGNITEWNKGAEMAFGYSEIEILGNPLTVLTSKKHKKLNAIELIKTVKKIKNNKKADSVIMQCLRKNGEEFPVEFALSRLKVEGNVFYCAMMLDISERFNLEKKLREKTKDLELFLYRSAHDLKAPFSSAQGLINLLKEENDINKIHNLLELLETTLKSGKELTDSLTEVSVINAKKIDYVKIDFKQCINNVISTLSGTKDCEHIKMNININTPKTFISQPELIKSLFQNLIENAIKYSKEPSENHKPFIDINVSTKERELLISICDNGRGIGKKNINKIFDLYFRVNHKEGTGNGLGLYVVKCIVEKLEGKINVKSNLNHGTCFEIHLPIFTN
jgi:PAS domain S-box-containing protein